MLILKLSFWSHKIWLFTQLLLEIFLWDDLSLNSFNNLKAQSNRNQTKLLCKLILKRLITLRVICITALAWKLDVLFDLKKYGLIYNKNAMTFKTSWEFKVETWPMEYIWLEIPIKTWFIEKISDQIKYQLRVYANYGEKTCINLVLLTSNDLYNA
jgi:hypothetical protein